MNLLRNIFKTSGPDKPKTPETGPEDALRAAFNRQRGRAQHARACFAPSVNMIFSEDGAVKVCCHNRENILGQYPDKNIREIWNSADAVQFRQKMEEYKFLSGCRICSNDYYQGNFDAMPSRHFDNIPLNAAYPTMMEFMLNNTCNLECVMCTGELSSSIRRNRDKLPPIKSPYGKEFISDIAEFIPHLTETRFSSSGEAFLIDMNFKLWDLLIEKNPSCLIVVQTNGTVLNARVKDFLNRGNFQIGVSLDSLQKETFESIRVNASFERVMENILYFAGYSKQHNRTFTISTCIMRQNWHELPDFINFCNSVGAVATFHKVWAPLQYALHNLPAGELQKMHQQLAGRQFPANTPLEKLNARQYEYYVSVIEGWMKDAAAPGDDPVELESLTTGQLRQRINNNLKNYILNQTMLESNKEELIMLCENKIEAVLDLCENEHNRRLRLLMLCAIPLPLSLPAIKTYPPEKLYEMSVNQVNNN